MKHQSETFVSHVVSLDKIALLKADGDTLHVRADISSFGYLNMPWICTSVDL